MRFTATASAEASAPSIANAAPRLTPTRRRLLVVGWIVLVLIGFATVIDHDWPGLIAVGVSTGLVSSGDRSFRGAARVVRDWLGLFAFLAAYGVSRALADTLGMPVQEDSVIVIDKILGFGESWVHRTQRLIDWDGAPAWWEVSFPLTYSSHFLASMGALIVLYVSNRPRWKQFMSRWVTLPVVGLVGYIIVPTVPPWMASENGTVAPVFEGNPRGWSYLDGEAVSGLFEFGRDTINPIAAMPSLHAAYPMLLLLFFAPAKGVVGRVLLAGYCLHMGFAVVISGQHWLVDVFAGWACALAVHAYFTKREARNRDRASQRRLHVEPLPADLTGVGQLDKLIIQIPCWDEEDQLPVALSALPREVAGFKAVEWLVIDDGSTDNTTQVALDHGVDHIVSFPRNRGLASAFQAGLDAALKLGADVIVNTDADNQYDAGAIPALVAPIVAGQADMTVGDRDVRSIEEFSAAKKKLQLLGSWVVRKASGADVADSTSGFRAYSREAALQLTVVSPFTYTIESIIQAGRSRTAITNVPVATNPKMRESRLFGSTWGYIRRNGGVIARVFAAYEPIKFFGTISGLLFLASGVGFLPFLFDWFVNGDRTGHVQSIVVASVLAVAALQVFVLAILADMMRNQRVVSQRILERVRRMEVDAATREVCHVDSARPRREAGDTSPASLAEALGSFDDAEFGTVDAPAP